MKKLLVAGFAALACITSALADFSKYVECTVSYSGTGVDNFPVLVRISDTKISGFYDEVQNAGADLKFTDEHGSGDYPYEIDVWDPTGESLVWVKLPRFANGLKFRMYYGDASKTTNSSASDVWTGYVAVMHLGGVNGINDSVAGYVGQAFGDDATSGYDSTGPVGGGWINSAEIDSVKGGGLELLNSSAANVRTGFSMSMWMKHKTGQGCSTANREMILYKRGSAFSPAQGQYALTVEPNQASPWSVYYYSSSTGVACWGSKLSYGQGLGSDTWKHIATSIDFSNGKWLQFCNGAKTAEGTDASKAYISDNEYNITLGSSQSEAYPSWKGSFDEVRIYDGVKGADWFSAEYGVMSADVISFGSPAVPYNGLEGSFSANVTSGDAPLAVQFTADFHGGTGSYTYEWDFLGEDNFVSGGATASHSYDFYGMYTVKVRVSDGNDIVIITNENMVAVSSAIYVNSEASSGGDGSLENPFNSLADAFADISLVNAIYIKGVFDLDPTVSIKISRPGILLAKWGDANDPSPVFQSTGTARATSSGVFDIDGEGTVVSNINFRYTADLQKSGGGGPLFYVETNNVTFCGCEFDLIDDNDTSKYDYLNGVIKHKNRWQHGLLIKDCYFSDFNLGAGTTFRVLNIAGVRVEHSIFTNCATILSCVDNTFDYEQHFVSNIVYDSVCTGLTLGTGYANHNVGAVGYAARGGNGPMFCTQVEIFGNLLINHSENAGCIFDLSFFAWDGKSQSGYPLKGPKPSQTRDGLLIHNNTVVGYDALVSVGNAFCGSAKLSIVNNLSIGDTYTLIDKCSPTDPGFNASASYFCNNYRTGGSNAFDVDYNPASVFSAVADNVLTNAPIFKSVNSSNKNYYVPRKDDKAAWLFNAYVDGGKHPAYIGAREPMKPDGMEIHIR